MIKSLLYYIALLLFVIYNCNTPLNYIKNFIPASVGKYLLSFPAFIVVTTILVVYPILTGKELLTFNTDPNTMSNIFRSDTSDSVNRATVVIDDSGEIVLEKSADINKNFTDLITSLRNDLNAINSKVNNNSNILKNQLISLTNATKTNINNLNGHFAHAATADSAITPARMPKSSIKCPEYREGAQNSIIGYNDGGGERGSNTDSYCNKSVRGQTKDWWRHGVQCDGEAGDVAWLGSGNGNNKNVGTLHCIRKNGLRFESANKIGASGNLPSMTTDFSGLQIS